MISKTVTLTGNSIPATLQTIPSPPKKLYIRGDLQAILKQPVLAVVGTRKISAYGREVTEKLVRQACDHGIAIISGLALGLDGVAIQAALEQQAPTIAVMPAGLDTIYPKTNYHLGMRLLKQGGALVGEYPDGKTPQLHHFTQRNRIVSGLADAVLIPEAGAKGGTMRTAQFAIEQGKTVLAVPGNINSFQSQGPNNLIKAGAQPVTEIEDILFALGLDPSTAQTELFADTNEEMVILQLLKSGVGDIHELQSSSKLSASAFNQALSMLEINGKIKSHGGGQWSLR